MAPVRRRGDLHNATDRLDPELLAMLVDKALQDLRLRIPRDRGHRSAVMADSIPP